MNVEVFKERYPDIELEELFAHLPRISLSEYPELSDYSWHDCHRGFIGAGGLFLVSDLAKRMEFRAGMRVLDLCCGNCVSSIYLARHYGVRVVAADRAADPSENWSRVLESGQADTVIPVRMDARDLRLPREFFDAVFCLNSYFYFGTDDLYLAYLARFIRPRGRIGIASPCYANELTSDTPKEFLYDAPDFAESRAVHSPPWWKAHFERAGLVRLVTCEEHPRGRELWLDEARWLIEETHPRDMEPWMRDMVYQEIVMLLSDQERFVTYLRLVAEREP